MTDQRSPSDSGTTGVPLARFGPQDWMRVPPLRLAGYASPLATTVYTHPSDAEMQGGGAWVGLLALIPTFPINSVGPMRLLTLSSAVRYPV